MQFGEEDQGKSETKFVFWFYDTHLGVIGNIYFVEMNSTCFHIMWVVNLKNRELTFFTNYNNAFEILV